MNSRFFFKCRLWFALTTSIAFVTQVIQATDVTRLSGSYEVVRKADAGPRTTVHLRVHLLNQGSTSLSIQRMALRDFSHPTRDQVRACALTISPGASADSMQEFTIPRMEYEDWQRGNAPTIILELVASGRRSTEVLRLTRISDRKGN